MASYSLSSLNVSTVLSSKTQLNFPPKSGLFLRFGLVNNFRGKLLSVHAMDSSASPEYLQGYPSEVVEESKFVPLNPEDPTYGPPALLLLGFKVEETNKIQELLKDLDGEFLQVTSAIQCCDSIVSEQIIFCTEEMITRSLWDAVNSTQQNLETIEVAKSLPRICFLSGLSGEEMIMFIEAFEESGVEPAIFAALVPNSANKSLQELIDEVVGDHEMMTAQQSDSE